MQGQQYLEPKRLKQLRPLPVRTAFMDMLVRLGPP